MLERITARRVVLAEQAELLGKQLAEIEVELAEITTAERVVTRLHAEDEPVVADGAQDHKGDSAMVGGAEPGTVVPYRRDVSGAGELSAEYQRVLAVMEQTDGPLRCKQICERLQIGTEARKVEAMRSRMKRLVDRGWLRETGRGAFTTLN
ncbi:hypothetical protein [Streptomyces clavifer]|uniref:hypothetical protein n=1 Tax=Streptomyces clavifer TaxID=68188 RepID=UPI0036B2EE4D